MKLLVILCLVVISVNSDHLIVGNVANRVILAHHHVASYNAIPFMKRVKSYFYAQPDNRLIQGIQALDNLHSKASMNITAGGVGYSYVNLRMKSERGSGLEYDIGIYVPDVWWLDLTLQVLPSHVENFQKTLIKMLIMQY